MKAIKAVSMADDYQTESDANTLIRAIEIRKDKARLKKAIDFAKTKVMQYKGAIAESIEDEGEME